MLFELRSDKYTWTFLRIKKNKLDAVATSLSGTYDETLLRGATHEQRLSSTYLNTLDPPVGRSVVPHLFTKWFYRRRQEDPHEFLFDDRNGVLKECQAPTLHSLLRGRDHPWLVCSNSTCSDPTNDGQPWRRRATGFEDFTHLSLPLVQEDIKDGHMLLLSSVQEALTGFLKPEQMSTGFAWNCQVCGSTAPPFKVSDIISAPEVLMLQLNRWAHHREQGALLHRVEPNREISFGSQQYSLCSFVCHIGTTVKSGHYTCCVKNPCPRGE